MTESPALNKLAVLKRAMTGGLLSALVTGIPIFISYFLRLQSPDLLSVFLNSFALPGMVMYLPFDSPSEPSGINLFHILSSLLYWFIFGAALSFFIKNNTRVISWWLFLVLTSSAVITFLINSAAHAFN
jgi:hypothetical protein